MSTCNEVPPFSVLLALVPSLLATSCFDVEKVSLTNARIHRIDDFEDGDSVPSAREFAHWACYAWQTDAPLPTCLVTSPGNGSKNGESLTFDLVTPIDSTLAPSVGVELGVFPRIGTVDLSPWENLRFAAKFEPSDPASPEALVLVHLPCKSVNHSGPPPTVEYRVHVPRNWESFTAPFSEFAPPDYLPLGLDSGECVTRVDNITYAIALLNRESKTVDGAAGTLTIDDVYLE